MTILERPQPTLTRGSWLPVCRADALIPGRGVAALVDHQAVAIFRLDAGERAYAIANVDPCSGASVLSRGLTGQTTVDGEVVHYVASPIRKERFDLVTGRCLDAEVTVATWEVRIVDGIVQIAPEASSSSNGPETTP